MASQRGTFGGEPTTKKLTDLEELLLSFISKIHLGNTAIVETLGTSTANIPLTEIIESNLEFIDENIEWVAEDYDAGESILNVSIPREEDAATSTYSHGPSEPPNKRKRKETEVRNTNTLLADACKSFSQAQDSIKGVNDRKNEAINKLSNSIHELAVGYVEINKQKNDIATNKIKIRILFYF